MLQLRPLECAFGERTAAGLHYSAAREMMVFVTSAGYLILQEPSRRLMCAPLAAYESAYDAYRALRLPKRFPQRVTHAELAGKMLLINVHNLTLLEHATATCTAGKAYYARRAAVVLGYQTTERPGTQTLLIFDDCAFGWLLQQQQIGSRSIFIQENALCLLRKLASQCVDFSISAHSALLQICARNARQRVLQLAGYEAAEVVKTFDGVCAHHQLWRLLGFYGTRPENDFRASGSLGLLAVAYFSAYDADFLMRGSHVAEITTKKAVLDFFRGSASWPYKYPVAVSIITVTHSLLYFPDNLLLPLLTSECTVEHKAMAELHPQIAAFCHQEMNGGTYFFADSTTIMPASAEQGTKSVMSEPLRECCLLYRDRAYSALQNYDFYESKLIPLRPIHLCGKTFSTAAPAISGVFLKLVCQLVELLEARLSRYKAQNMYMSYNAELKRMLAEMVRILESGFDVLGFEDLMARMKE